MSLRSRVRAARERVREWLDGMGAGEGLPPEARRFSAAHDPEAWPGMLLPATYDAVHCLRLLGAYGAGDPSLPGASGAAYDARRAAEYLNSFQDEAGAWRLPGMRDSDCRKRDDAEYTREYIDFHASNYAWGAVRALGFREGRPLRFLRPYLRPEGFARWLSRRGWDDPWMEGNAFVNLGGFLVEARNDGDREAGLRLSEMLSWLDAHQDPATGFWGDELRSRRGLLHGMAGAMHTFHLYWIEGRELPRLDAVTEACLSLARDELDGPTSACLDVDIVDALANCHRLGRRRSEIERVLEKKLGDLLDLQNPDGGFPDERAGLLRFDGWVRGYAEPQGLSNCFATWFRMAAIAMAESTLHPEQAASWRFRTTAGIGYFPTKKGS